VLVDAVALDHRFQGRRREAELRGRATSPGNLAVAPGESSFDQLLFLVSQATRRSRRARVRMVRFAVFGSVRGVVVVVQVALLDA